MKRKQLILLIIMLLLLAAAGTLLPHAVIAYWKSKMLTMTWTQANQEETLDFNTYTRQFGECEISGNLSEQNIRDAMLDLIITYIRVGLLPDLDVVDMTMPEYSLYYDETERETLSATLQSDHITVQFVLRSETLFPVSIVVQGPYLSMDIGDFMLLLSQHYQIKGGYTKANDGTYEFISKDDTLKFIVAPFKQQTNLGIRMETIQ